MILSLRNLVNEYKKVNNSKRREVFYDEKNNNMIVFDPCDKETDTHSICNGIADDMYGFLINELNTEKDLVVMWSQVEGTTSDYTIYCDYNPSQFVEKKWLEIVEILSHSTEQTNTLKYNMIKDGKLIHVRRKGYKESEDEIEV